MFLNRGRFRLAIDRRGGRENQAPRTLGKDRFEEGKSGGGVVAEVDLGVLHGLARFDERGEVEHTVKGLPTLPGGDEKTLDCASVGQLPVDKLDAWGEQIETGVTEVVEYHRLVSQSGQKSRNGTTDVPRTTGYQYLHKKTAPQ